MCGAYGLTIKKAKEVYDRFNVQNTLLDFSPRYNLRPGQMNPIITRAHDTNTISRMFWGLLPHFAKDENYKYKTINARAETVAQLPTFREPLRRKRCLVPATGFYEPDKIHNTKPPYPWSYFHLKTDAIFAFAGIYDIWKDKVSGKEIASYAIITTGPNGLIGAIHDRMPVILNKQDEATWLDPESTEPRDLLPLLISYPADRMEGWSVSAAARNPRNDYPELISPT